MDGRSAMMPFNQGSAPQRGGIGYDFKGKPLPSARVDHQLRTERTRHAAWR